jgi:protoheme IX farnesyltransferase
MSIQTRAQTLDLPFDILSFSELTKPELTGLSVLTAVCAYYMGSTDVIDLWKMFYASLGTLLVGAAAGTLNQYVERDLDSLMKRTERRPLPSGRLSPVSALAFGIVLSFSGFFVLLAKTNPLTFFIALATLTSYLFLYTPLKRKTPFNTVIGAVVGALPTLIGWAAVRNEISWSAMVLFGIVFAWQIPHFLSLGWMYRKDYARAGFKMLPVVDEGGGKTGRDIFCYSIILLAVSTLLTLLKLTGYYYMFGAIGVGVLFLIPAYGFIRASRSKTGDSQIQINTLSKRIFFASLAYLPVLMLLMVVDKVS